MIKIKETKKVELDIMALPKETLVVIVKGILETHLASRSFVINSMDETSRKSPLPMAILLLDCLDLKFIFEHFEMTPDIKEIIENLDKTLQYIRKEIND